MLSKLSQATVTTGSLNSQDMIKILQDMISQVNLYMMDTVQRYYVMFMCGGQYSTDGHMVLSKSFFKNLLHNFA